jgi:hypothetical protein
MVGEIPRKPLFLYERPDQIEDRTFRPVAPPRRGELLAFIFAGGLILVVLLRAMVMSEISYLPLFLAGLFLLAAILIAYGNWMERNTWIRIDADGVVFHKPIREINMRWDEIEELRSSRYRGGWSVMVTGGISRFIFHSEIRMQSSFGGEVRTGFPQGEHVAAVIRKNAGLGDPEYVGEVWICGSPGQANPEPGL